MKRFIRRSIAANLTDKVVVAIFLYVDEYQSNNYLELAVTFARCSHLRFHLKRNVL